MASDPRNARVSPPTHEERMVLAAMRARWEAMFRGTVDDEELDRVLRDLEAPLSTLQRDADPRHDRQPRGTGPTGH